DIGEGPEATLRRVAEAVGRMHGAQGGDPPPLSAIGMGLPGPVEHSTGRAINPPIMPGWDRFDVPGYLQRTYRVPVLVDNDVNIMALGERHVALPTVDDLVFIKVATGIG